MCIILVKGWWTVILNGWKEIANYLGRGVRTVQRWEQFGLPVRRPKGSDRSAVLALSEELDVWIKNCSTHNRPVKTESSPLSGVQDLKDKFQRTAALVASVRAQRAEVVARSQQLRCGLAQVRQRIHRGVPLAAMAAAAPDGRPAEAPPAINTAK